MNQSGLIDIKSLNPLEMEELVKSLGEKQYRAKQLFRWLHANGVLRFDEMTNLSKSFQAGLEERCYITGAALSKRQTDSDRTEKFLFEFSDGNTIETVLMRHDYGNSLCISSQVGCRMGCRFCASTIGGRVRNLTASEMLEQVYAAQRLTDARVDSIVMMGIGEPLDNFEQLVRFLELIRDPDGLGLSHRHLSLSTCGLVDEMIVLAKYRYQLTLSVSLHAADDETRNLLMPVNRKYPIGELMKACRYYFQETGRRISYEYALIKGINDSVQQAKKLSTLLKGQNCHVNLIPVNPVSESKFLRSPPENITAFYDILSSAGIQTTRRREMGAGIDAACGQLRRKERLGR